MPLIGQLSLTIMEGFVVFGEEVIRLGAVLMR
jgi:hypothetical protein